MIGESGSSSPDKMSSERETRTYTITSRPEHLDQVEHMFRWMNMAAGGHSGSMLLSIDGDGAARVKIEKQGGELAKPPEQFKTSSDKGPEFQVCMDNLNEVRQVLEVMRPTTVHFCPHCKTQIYEKHTYVENDVEYHAECKGAIKWPPIDWSTVSPEWRAILEPHCKK